MSERTYDVVICGGGLAGLTLARQLSLEAPEISTLVLDKLARPLPQGAFKVGESTVSVGAHYLADILKIREYLDKSHLPKLEIRHFFGNSRGPLEQRPEFGVSHFPTHSRSYQIDRGILENDLREMIKNAGIELQEGVSVQEIELGVSEKTHQVNYKDQSGLARSVSCRWVVDAMGRRRYLQKKLGLSRRLSDERYSAAWFRIEGRIDLTDFVPTEERAWHKRVSDRYYSTNHLMGTGYWVWLIALSSGCTSIGIVTSESFHPFSGYNTYERAQVWLQEHEPLLAMHLNGRKPMDFLKLRDYSYTSRRTISPDRWACVGEAAVFSDPFYSPGTDIIGLTNITIVDSIKKDRAGRMDKTRLDELNSFLLGYNDGVTYNIQSGYSYHGRDMVMASKLVWDLMAGVALSGPLMFNRFFLDREAAARIRKVVAMFAPLSLRIQKMLVDWGAKTQRLRCFEFLDYFRLPFFVEMRLRNLKPDKTVDDLVADSILNMEAFEELAQAMFLLAAEDLYPERFELFPKDIWINAWGISLDPNQWEKDKLFKPKSLPRLPSAVRQQYRSAFRL